MQRERQLQAPDRSGRYRTSDFNRKQWALRNRTPKLGVQSPWVNRGVPSRIHTASANPLVSFPAMVLFAQSRNVKQTNATTNPQPQTRNRTHSKNITANTQSQTRNRKHTITDTHPQTQPLMTNRKTQPHTHNHERTHTHKRNHEHNHKDTTNTTKNARPQTHERNDKHTSTNTQPQHVQLT